MSHIIHPHQKPYNALFSDMEGATRHYFDSLTAWSKTTAQIALEAQKDALRNMAASDDSSVVYSTLGGHWDIGSSKTEDWKTRALILRQQHPHQGYIAVFAKISPVPTEAGSELIEAATQRMSDEREGMDLIESILMGDSDELKALKSDSNNFNSYADCPVDEINIAHCRSIDQLHGIAKAIVNDEYCPNSVIRAKANQHTKPSFEDGDGYAIETEVSAPVSDIVDILQVLSEAVDTSDERELVDHGLDFIRKNGIETYAKNNAEFIALAARGLMNTDGLVTDSTQEKFARILYTIYEREYDLEFLPGLADALKDAGHVGPDAKYDCNDMRNQGYLKSDGSVVEIETQNGIYEVRYEEETLEKPAAISLHRAKPVDEFNKNDCGLVRNSGKELREVACFINVGGAWRVNKSRTRTDGSALFDVVDILGSAHTITVCMEDDAEANNKTSPIGP
jgi:hypothetical protein